MLEMLTEIDRICKKHSISYLLFAGTMLGAVRHQGFIPWDDDLDVIMRRPDYERFLKLAPSELDSEAFYLQKEFSEHWPMFFSKLRKNGTTCLERYYPKDPEMHQGVYVDIFPADNLADGKLLRRLQFWSSKVVIAKSLDRRGYLTDSFGKQCFILLCRFLPGKPFARFVQLRKADHSSLVHSFFGGASRYEKNIYPRAWFENVVTLPFETGTFPVSAEYDEMLTRLYGDYRTPLREDARGRKIHAEFVDLEHSYEQYLGKQRAFQFGDYSRSIR